MSSPESGASPSLTRRALHGVLWLGILNSSASLLVVGLNAYLNRSLPGGPGEMGLWLFVLEKPLVVIILRLGRLGCVCMPIASGSNWSSTLALSLALAREAPVGRGESTSTNSTRKSSRFASLRVLHP